MVPNEGRRCKSGAACYQVSLEELIYFEAALLSCYERIITFLHQSKTDEFGGTTSS